MSSTEYHRQYRADHAEEMREYWRDYRAKNAEAVRAGNNARHAALRAEALAHYGTECACCGSTDRLELDHVNGDGAEHRAEVGGKGNAFLYWLKRNGFPNDKYPLQTLCNACNRSKSTGTQCKLHIAD
jgi:5-methylcytosine-specific restriction endonuclease McrA